MYETYEDTGAISLDSMFMVSMTYCIIFVMDIACQQETYEDTGAVSLDCMFMKSITYCIIFAMCIACKQENLTLPDHLVSLWIVFCG